MNRNRFYVWTIIAIFIAAFFLLPALLTNNSLVSVCSLPRANAQDNPCLAHEATLSVLALQATLDTTNYRATISALEVLTQPISSTQAVSAPNLPYEEDFSGESDIELGADSDGAVRLSQGTLLVSANPGRSKAVSIPGVSVADNFYIQVDVIPNVRFARIAIQLCNASLDTCHDFFVRPTGPYGTDRDPAIGVADSGTVLFMTRYREFWEQSIEPFTLGLEATGGFYTIYFNGAATETTRINQYGGVVRLKVYDDGGGAEAFFDNVVIREVR